MDMMRKALSASSGWTPCDILEAVTVSQPPVTASCRPDMRWAARQALRLD